MSLLGPRLQIRRLRPLTHEYYVELFLRVPSDDLPIVMVVPHRSHRWTTYFSEIVVCIATLQMGHGLGGMGFAG